MPIHALTPVTIDTCWHDPLFIAYWDEVEDLTNNRGWDDSPMLDITVDAFNQGLPPLETADLLKEADAEAAFEAYMSIPPWDR